MKPALLVIDVQNDYFPEGRMELFEIEIAADNIRKLVFRFRKNNWPVIFIQHLAIKPRATFFIPGTDGAEIHESVKPMQSEKIIIKNYPNSFRNTELQEYLKTQNLKELVICGAMSHMCVDTTVRAAADLGYICTLIADACATRDLIFNDQRVKATDVQVAFMAALKGTFAEVLNLEDYIKRIR